MSDIYANFATFYAHMRVYANVLDITNYTIKTDSQ